VADTRRISGLEVAPDPGLTERLAGSLPGAPIGGPLLAFRSVTSTQEIVRVLGVRGLPEGTVVVAEHQTTGRGRRGRVWITPPGAGLLLSVLLRPVLPPARWPAIGLAAACAVADGVEEAAGVTPGLRWPNDVLVDGRKVAGVLAEGVTGPVACVLLGIGINLRGEPGEWSADLAGRAASLASLGRPAEPEAVLAAVLRHLAARYEELQRLGFESIRRAWRRRGLFGGPVTGPGVSGVAVDLGPDGGLVVEGVGGRRTTIVAGEVAIAEPVGERTTVEPG
jgi:BirA family biotin operon repressor/biotin-[acetyl-CoA-carboxylase] ligase